MNYINEIADALLSNHAAVMVGAGFSKNADKIATTDKWFKNWNELSDMFYDTVYGKDSKEPGKQYNSSLRLAQEVEITVGRPKLEKILKDAIPDEYYGPSEVYTKLMELPWRDVFTTNYDTLLERAADKISKRRYNIIVNQEDLVNSNDAARIIKLHGSFPSQRPFIITEEDYRTYPVKFAAMVNTVQQSLLENVFCMIGFSCEDPNFLNWIGWIHDNIGKSCSHKIYMVSVTHVLEAKQKFLLDKNIIVVDLESLYSKKGIPERLSCFFDDINKVIDQKNNATLWFNLEDVSLDKKSYREKAKKLKELNNTYPGWIFLPWEMKNRVNSVLNSIQGSTYLLNEENFELLPINDQIEYIYEYTKFLNIVGRPMFYQDAEKYWKILKEININDNKIVEQQIQYIYLQLLRSFREFADWKNYDICRKRILESALKYEEKQFLFVCDWWMALYRFQDINLKEKLDKWILIQNDFYWSMIKASLYAMLGETEKGEQILTNILPKIRKKLVKGNYDPYLCSIEESVVSLLNFIRQGNWYTKFEREKTFQTEEVKWWETNDKYCSKLKERDNIDCKEKKENFYLNVSYTTVLGRNNEKVCYALDYLRFLEQTAHPFRIKYVVNKNGFQDVIKTLYRYYPHWCFVQMVIAQDEKEIDLLYGRSNLALMSQEEVDKVAQEFLSILELTSKNIKPENAYWTKSIYDYSAQIIPQFIARFCYKCSLGMLDKIFHQMLILCRSNVHYNFKDINKILKAILTAYTVEEQKERIETILNFPIKREIRNKYYDPVNYLKLPKKKYRINSSLYVDTMAQIKSLIRFGDEEESEDAIERLMILEQCIVLKKSDKEYLYKILEEKNSLIDYEVLYQFDKKRYNSNLGKILDGTIKLMKNDAIEGMINDHSSNYSELIRILPDLKVELINYQEIFEVMTKLINKNSNWNNRDFNFLIDDRSIKSYSIAIGLLLLKYKEKEMMFFNDEKKNIIDYFNALNKYYSSSKILICLEQIIINGFNSSFNENDKDVYIEMEELLWTCSEEDMKLLYYFYLMCYKMTITISNIPRLLKFSKNLYKIIIYKIINKKIEDIKLPLQVLYELIINNIYDEEKNKILLLNFPRFAEETKIKAGDSEEIALLKIHCRIDICNIARQLYNLEIYDENILLWKEISEDSDEFVEIRNIKFE